jgi:hypothetical protein
MTWKKGQSGNPNGRAKDKLWADAIRIAVNEAYEDGDKKKLRVLADRLVDKALEGEISAMKEIGDRLDGKAAQSVDVTHHKSVEDMSDDELIEIIRSDRDVDETDSQEVVPSIH